MKIKNWIRFMLYYYVVLGTVVFFIDFIYILLASDLF